MYKLETYMGKDKLPVLEKQLICEEVVSASSPEKVYEMLNKYFRLNSRTEEYCFISGTQKALGGTVARTVNMQG